MSISGENYMLTPQQQIDAVCGGRSTPKELVNTVIQERARSAVVTGGKQVAATLDDGGTYYMFNSEKNAEAFKKELEQLVDKLVKALAGVSSTEYRFKLYTEPDKKDRDYYVVRALDSARLQFDEAADADTFLDRLETDAADLYLTHAATGAQDVLPQVYEPWSFKGAVVALTGGAPTRTR